METLSEVIHTDAQTKLLVTVGAPYFVKFIQGVTGGMCETSGECSLGQTIPI